MQNNEIIFVMSFNENRNPILLNLSEIQLIGEESIQRAGETGIEDEDTRKAKTN